MESDVPEFGVINGPLLSLQEIPNEDTDAAQVHHVKFQFGQGNEGEVQQWQFQIDQRNRGEVNREQQAFEEEPVNDVRPGIVIEITEDDVLAFMNSQK